MNHDLQEELLKNVLLGTNRYTLADFGQMQALADKLENKSKTKEEILLGVAYAHSLYQEVGKIPKVEKIEGKSCPPETLPYHSDKEADLLKTSFTTNDTFTQHYLLQRCLDQKLIARPDLVVFCLQKALAEKKKKDLYLGVVGNLGQWLCQLNPEWEELLANFTHQELSEETWQTGTQEQRVQYLQKIRQENPNYVITLLEAGIQKENAAQRQDFVAVLEDGLSLSDEPFLMQLRQDKSKNVRQLVQDLLKKIKGGKVQSEYLAYLSEALKLEKQSKNLGLSTKMTFAIAPDKEPSKELFGTGIEKISSQKNIPDKLYWVAQMLAFVSPSLLAARFAITEEQLLEALCNQKANEKKFLIDYLVESTLLFEHKAWALALIKQENVSQPALFSLLPESEKWEYLHVFIKNGFRDFMLYLLNLPYFHLPSKAATEILTHLHKHPFELDTVLYKKLAFYLSPSMLTVLYEFAQEDHKQNYQLRHFQTQISEMINLLEALKAT